MNQTIFYFFYDLTRQSEFFDKLVIFTAEIFPYIVILLAFLFLLYHHEVFSSAEPLKNFLRKWKEFFLVFFSGLAAWVLAYVLKFLFHAARPFDSLPQIYSLIPETGYAFPSGHATFFMALAFAVFFSHRQAGSVFIFFAFLIGLARIAAGVHFPADILGGFALGFLIAFLLRKKSGIKFRLF